MKKKRAMKLGARFNGHIEYLVVLKLYVVDAYIVNPISMADELLKLSRKNHPEKFREFRCSFFFTLPYHHVIFAAWRSAVRKIIRVF